MQQGEDANQFNEKKTREFVHLMSVNQMKIYAYIMSIVGNSNDADDIMQNTSAFMWNKYAEFKSGTDFVSWGISIAYYKIKEFRNQQKRFHFSEEVVEQLHTKAHENLTDVNLYVEKLQACLKRLPHNDLNLIKLRYEAGLSIKKISLRVNKTVQAVYMELSKIHGILSRCINRLIVQDTPL